VEGYDVINVGLSSAGCALAARLSVEPHARCCASRAWTSRRPRRIFPIGFWVRSEQAVLDPRSHWRYEIEIVDGRSIPVPRAAGSSGGGAVDGSVCKRGPLLRWRKLKEVENSLCRGRWAASGVARRRFREHMSSSAACWAGAASCAGPTDLRETRRALILDTSSAARPKASQTRTRAQANRALGARRATNLVDHLVSTHGQCVARRPDRPSWALVDLRRCLSGLDAGWS
jgi:hypothetical protein